MSMFSNRPKSYKAGLILFFLAFVLFLVGFAIPFWATADYFAHNFVRNTFGAVDFHEGLWMYCTSSDGNATDCAALSFRGLAPWFQFVRVLEGLCLSGLITASLHGLRQLPPHLRWAPAKVLESLIATSGILGFIGCMVYLRKLRSRTTDEEEKRVLDTTVYFIVKDHALEEAYYFALIGSILSVVAAVVIYVFNKPHFNYKPLDLPTRYVAGSVLFTTATNFGQGQCQGQSQGHPANRGHDGKPPQAHDHLP